MAKIIGECWKRLAPPTLLNEKWKKNWKEKFKVLNFVTILGVHCDNLANDTHWFIKTYITFEVYELQNKNSRLS